MDIKHQFLNSKPRVTKVSIEGVGEVYVRSLTCKEMTLIQNADDDDKIMLEFCLGLCDQQVTPVFNFDTDKDELAEIHIHHIIQVVNEIGRNSTLAAKIEDAKKN